MNKEHIADERPPPMLTRRGALITTAGCLLTTTLSTMTATAQQSSREIWAFETSGSIESSPTVVDGTVFVGSDDGNLYAVEAESGTEQWAFETGRWVESSPTVADNTVFIASWNTNLHAVDAERGTQQWAFETGSNIYSSPTVADGTAFIGSHDHNLYAVDADTGAQQWTFETSDVIFSTPTVVDETVFIGSHDENLYAVDAESGTEQWAFKTGEDVYSSPTVSDGTVFVGSQDGNLYAVDVETGTEQWDFGTRGNVESSPTVVDGTVFVGSGDNLYAVDAETGTEQWAFETGANVESSPTVVDGTVFVGSNDGNLYAVDAGVESSSEGSRAMLGTLGHHDDWRYSNQSIDIPFYSLYVSWIRNNSVLLMGGLGSVVAGGYLFRRRRQSNDHSQEETTERASDDAAFEASGTNIESTASADETPTDSESSAGEHRAAAETAIKWGKTNRSKNDFTSAADAYSRALTEYQAALSELQAGDNEERSAIEDAIESTRADLEAVKTRRDQRNDVTDTLKPAERSFQEAIVAFVTGDQTIARIRFRQARDTLGETMEIIDQNDTDLFTSPVEVAVEPDRSLSSTTLRELPSIPEAAAIALSDAGVETVSDLTGSDEAPWTPQEVIELAEGGELSDKVRAILTVLSWWRNDEGYEFSSVEAVSRRQQQAAYGFEQAK